MIRKSTEIKILPLSSYEPEKDIVIVNIDVGMMRAKTVKKYIENVKKMLKPMFDKRGFESLYIPVRYSPKTPGKEYDIKIKSSDFIDVEDNKQNEQNYYYKEAMKLV